MIKSIDVMTVSFAVLVVTGAVDLSQVNDRSMARLAGIRLEIRLGHYVEAESAARGLVADADPNLDATAARLILLQALLRNGRGTEPDTRRLAEMLARESRERAAAGPVSSDAGEVLEALGEVHFQSGDYTAAAAAFQDGSRLLDNIADTGAAQVRMQAWHALALTQIEQYDEALRICDRGFLLQQSRRVPEDENLEFILEVRGFARQRKGEYVQARADLERAVAVREQLQDQHPETARALMRLGTEMWLEGQVPQSRAVFERAAGIAQSTLRDGHPDLAEFLRMLAIPLQDLGDFQQARSLQERGLSIARRTLGDDHPMTALQMNDLANTLFFQGNIAEARSLYERSLVVGQERFGPDNLGVTSTVYNLALLNAALGDLAEARRLNERALSTWTKLYGPRHPLIARGLAAFADALTAQRRDREAVPMYRRALAIRTQALGLEHPSVARTEASLAETLVRLGQTREALSLSQQALTILATAGTEETEGFASTLVIRGRAQLALKDTAGALQSLERARTLRRQLLGESHPVIAETDVDLATALMRDGRASEALTLALEAQRISDDHVGFTLRFLPERQALSFAAKHFAGLDLAMSLASDSNASEIYDRLTSDRAIVLDEMAARRRSYQASSTDIGPAWQALASSRQRLANLFMRGPGQQSPAQYVALLDQTTREREAAERGLADRSAEFRSELRRARIGFADVRALLQPAAALVSYVRYDRHIVGNGSRPASVASPPSVVPSYAAFVIRPGAETPILVPLGSAATLDALVRSWRQAMVDDVASRSGSLRPEPSLRALGTSLRKRIWDPVAIHLDAVSRVFVVPDGTLNLVPFAALPMSPGRYLLDDGPEIHYLSVERDLAADVAVDGVGRGLLAFGGPSFDDVSSFTRPNGTFRATAGRIPPASSPSGLRGTEPGCIVIDSMRFQSLPAARSEAESVASLWNSLRRSDANSELLTGPQATEGALKRLAAGHRILHVATHGFFLGEDCAPVTQGTRAVGGLVATGPKAAPRPQQAKELGSQIRPDNPLLLSGLALAGANKRVVAGPDDDDGILTAEEVSALNLDGVEWVVLSACDTGLGTLAAGEGVLGLRRAFQVAGVRTVIMSLWPVDDLATRHWMEALYKARLDRHLDTPASVHEASLNVLRERRAKRQSTNPLYWAGFVASGDWR